MSLRIAPTSSPLVVCARARFYCRVPPREFLCATKAEIKGERIEIHILISKATPSHMLNIYDFFDIRSDPLTQHHAKRYESELPARDEAMTPLKVSTESRERAIRIQQTAWQRGLLRRMRATGDIRYCNHRIKSLHRVLSPVNGCDAWKVSRENLHSNRNAFTDPQFTSTVCMCFRCLFYTETRFRYTLMEFRSENAARLSRTQRNATMIVLMKLAVRSIATYHQLYRHSTWCVFGMQHLILK